MSANAEETAPVRGLLNRKSLLLVAADTAQDVVPDGNQMRVIEASELFKQIREEAGLTPYPQDSDVWDITAHPKIFMVLKADTNLITINDDTPGQECQGEFIQDATGNHKLTINNVEMAISGKGRSMVKGLRWQDALRFDQPGPLAGAKPEITEQPIGMTATIGTTAAFKAKAINWDDVSLIKNGVTVPDAHGTAYQVAISFESKGAYQFKFSNRYGFTLTDPANIDSTESDIPAIVSNPTDQTIDEGGSFSLPFIVSGPNLIFRVYKNNTLISTSSANVYTKTAAKTTDSGTYRIEAGNTLGQVVSNTVTVTVNAIVLPVPVINFTQPSGMTVGGADQTLQASSSNSVTPIVFTSSDTSIATIISGNKLRVIAPGTVEITASQVAGNNYQAAVSVVRTVTMLAQPAAVITFVQPSNMTAGDADQALVFSSTNAVTPVTFTSSNTNVATIVSGKLHIVGAGTAQITASQIAGNGFQAAQPVSYSVTFTVPVAAVITFTQPAPMAVGDADQVLTATSTNSVTPVTFSTSNTNIATIVDGKLHVVAAGTVVITASQAAGNGFLAAASVTKSVTLSANQAVINFTAPTNMTVGDSDQVLVATSNNTVTPITFSTSDTSKATIVSGALHVIAAGTFSVYADQAAGNGYLAATRVSRTVTALAAGIVYEDYFIGDSITAGAVAESTKSNYGDLETLPQDDASLVANRAKYRWSKLLCDLLGITENNYGVSGMTLQDGETGNGSYPIFNKANIPTKVAKSKNLFFAFGANDINRNFSFHYAEKFYQTLKDTATYAVNVKGWSYSDIVFVTPYVTTQFAKNNNTLPGAYPSATKQTERDYVAATILAAKELGCILLDANKVGTDDAQWLNHLWTDELHPNKMGHEVLANAFAQSPFLPYTATPAKPAITLQPTAASTVQEGDNIILTVESSGAAKYRWKFKGNVISGAISQTLTIAGATSANAGDYTCDLINAGGTTTSATATVTVQVSNAGTLLDFANNLLGGAIISNGFMRVSDDNASADISQGGTAGIYAASGPAVLTKLAADSYTYNSGAITQNSSVLFGLAGAKLTAGANLYSQIDFCIQYVGNNKLNIFEKGVQVLIGSTTYTSEPKLEIRVAADGTVTYYANNGLLYTSAAKATYPLYAVGAFQRGYTQLKVYLNAATTGNTSSGGGTTPPPSGGEMVDFSQNLLGGATMDSSSYMITPTFNSSQTGQQGGTGSKRVTSGAATLTKLAADGIGDAQYFNIPAEAFIGYGAAALVAGDQLWQQGAFLFQWQAAGNNVNVIENSQVVYTTPSALTEEPKLDVKVSAAGAVTYWINDVLAFTSAKTAAYPLYVHSSFRNGGKPLKSKLYLDAANKQTF